MLLSNITLVLWLVEAKSRPTASWWSSNLPVDTIYIFLLIFGWIWYCRSQWMGREVHCPNNHPKFGLQVIFQFLFIAMGNSTQHKWNFTNILQCRKTFLVSCPSHLVSFLPHLATFLLHLASSLPPSGEASILSGKTSIPSSEVSASSCKLSSSSA